MSARRILVVDDEPPIRDLVSFALRRDGFDTDASEDVASARQRICAGTFDLVVLDWTLPGTPGVALARWLRADRPTRRLPILMLTARQSDDDRIEAFDAGVDDFVAKPFSCRELVARVRALLRRDSALGEASGPSHGVLRIDLAAHRAYVGDAVVGLGPTEFRLLAVLLDAPGHTRAREELAHALCGDAAAVQARTIDAHVARLRAALAPFGGEALVETVRGRGYRLAPLHFPASESSARDDDDRVAVTGS